MSNKKTTPIIILGMHRSGTSCLAGSFQEAGLCLGEVSLSNKYNKKGNRENNSIMNLSNEILAYNNASWDMPPNHTLNWTNDHLQKAKEISSQLSNDYKEKYWGFKDPRVLVTFNFWTTVFPSAKLIGTIRNPTDVALSLNRRDPNFSLEQGLKLWLLYNENLLTLLQNKPFPLISFDETSDRYKQKVELLLTQYLPKELINHSLFYDEKLRTPNNTTLPIPKEVDECYHALKNFLL